MNKAIVHYFLSNWVVKIFFIILTTMKLYNTGGNDNYIQISEILKPCSISDTMIYHINNYLNDNENKSSGQSVYFLGTFNWKLKINF